MNPWLPVWLALRAAGFLADGSVDFAREIPTRDRRVYVHATVWGGEAPVPFWCSGLHHSEGRCFVGDVPVLRQLPPVSAPVERPQPLRYLAFQGTAGERPGELWIATGCEQLGSAKAICLQRIVGDEAQEPAQFLTAPEESVLVDRLRIEGDVIFSRYGKEVYAQRGDEPPRRILEDVVEFDSEGTTVAYVDGHSVRLLELNADLERMGDTEIAQASGAHAVAIDSDVIAWVSDEGVSVAKGAPAEDVRTAGGYVVWSERVGDEHVLHAWRDGTHVVVGRTSFDEPFYFDVLQRSDGRVVAVWREGPARLTWRLL
ncbi:MAG TPA: hypothetical protein VF266_10800 [Thermoanaerobaculia bacterium]